MIGDFDIVRIPLDLYRARHATNREWLRSSQNGSPLASAPVLLAGDSAIGSPYFQSISLGSAPRANSGPRSLQSQDLREY